MSTSTHDVVNPATEEVVTTVDLVGLEETDAAVARAVEVGPAWRAVAPADRGMLLRDGLSHDCLLSEGGRLGEPSGGW